MHDRAGVEPGGGAGGEVGGGGRDRLLARAGDHRRSRDTGNRPEEVSHRTHSVKYTHFVSFTHFPLFNPILYNNILPD